MLDTGMKLCYIEMLPESHTTTRTDTMCVGDQLQFKHLPTGAIHSGIVVGFSEDYPNVVFVRADDRTVAVHKANIIGRG